MNFIDKPADKIACAIDFCYRLFAFPVSLPPQKGEEAERSGPLLASRRTSYDAQQLSRQLGRHT